MQTLPLAALLALLYALGRNADPSRPNPTPNQPTIVEMAPPDTEEDKKDAPPANATKPREAKLSDRRRRHILDGTEEGSGGHGPGRNTPNKDNFPSDWSDEKTIEAILDVANDPASTRYPGRKGKTIVEGTRDGVDIRIIIDKTGKSIVSAYPTNVPSSTR